MTRAIRINGVRIRPRWDWSPEYRRAVSEQLRGPPTRIARDARYAAIEKRAAAYLDWWLASRGIAKPEAAPGEQLRIFGEWERVDGRPTQLRALRYESGRRVGGARTRARWECAAVVATIEIPHWDFDPDAAPVERIESEEAAA